MVASHLPSLTFQILESGFYDLLSFQTETPAYLEGIRKSMILEGGNTLDALKVRSLLYHTDKVKASTLILQGEFDDRRQLEPAKRVHEKLLEHGIESVLKIYAHELHALPADKWDVIMPFVRQHFFDLYGIGIKVSDAKPAMQILRMHPDSPAYYHGRIHVGDAILSISPQNDEQELSTLNMPTEKFVSLVLGEKNTKLRLRLQHFDLSIEEMVFTRG